MENETDRYRIHLPNDTLRDECHSWKQTGQLDATDCGSFLDVTYFSMSSLRISLCQTEFSHD